MSRLADRRLLSKIQAGELDGLEGLFDRYGDACLTVARRHATEDALAEDIVFAVFIDLWKSPLLPSPPVRDWLLERCRTLASV